MPERGSVQLLLHFLRWRQAPGWKIGLAVALIAMLGLLSGEGSLYQKATTGLAQSLREAAWKHALAGEPESSHGPGTKRPRQSMPGAAARPECRRSL